ncbi:unnamed protein product [Ilex paraguariensis]|uniref:Uncharacterized protein n=1 Tax=Ilex paraguariensis TaxID=185542 RepID=A0ABC8UWY0_9AQUA
MAMGSSSNSTECVGVDTEPTALQKHVMFFDQNKDGILYPWETYQGGRAIGFGILRSTALAIFVHLFSVAKLDLIQSFFEWKLLYDIGKDKNGLLHKDTIRGVYDGSLFEKLAKEKASSGKYAVTPAYKGTT